MEIVITRSTKRRRTVSARIVGDKMLVRAPAGMPESRLKQAVENLKKRLERQALRKELNRKEDLADVCRRLNDKYFQGKIEVRLIEYSADQLRRFGSCNSRAKMIRISYRLGDMPRWVRDYVVVHEMAHVLEPNHGPGFWRLVSRYELAERARGYLMAKNFEDADESDVGPPMERGTGNAEGGTLREGESPAKPGNVIPAKAGIQTQRDGEAPAEPRA